MSLDGGLRLLSMIVRDGGGRPIADIAREAGIPLSTAQRWVLACERHGLLVHAGRGRRVAGPDLVAMTEGAGLDDVLRAAALPLLRRHAAASGSTVHLGVWDGEMVTYLAKASAGEAVFTQEGMKLEGYCSAVGKVLLAHLETPDREAYLAAGPFVALTARTIVTAERLRSELRRVARQGYAVDLEEVEEGLFCCAVPVRDAQGRVRAAVSESRRGLASGRQVPTELSALARSIETLVFRA